MGAAAAAAALGKLRAVFASTGHMGPARARPAHPGIPREGSRTPVDAPSDSSPHGSWHPGLPRTGPAVAAPTGLGAALPGRLVLSQIYGGRFAAGADLSSSVRGNECCYLNALPPQPLCFRFSKSGRVPRGSPLLPGCET
ncbi:hypothetical protein Nmel_004841 [Mimus melanotis]